MKLPLQCPSTNSQLRLVGHEWVTDTKTSYPLVGGVPWLFPDPKHTLADWRERASLSIEHLEKEVEDLKAASKATASELTRDRLEKVRTLKIRHLEMLRRVLEPLKPFAKLSLTQKKAYGYRLPLRQGLLGYVPNLIRDWSGQYESENKALFDSTIDLLKKTKPIVDTAELRILVLGSGSSRLAYDIALKFPKSQVIAFDLNPLLLLAAKQISAGTKVRATEFSVSPKDSAEPGRELELSRPGPETPNLEFIFGDVYALPFQDASFDICVSPWLVDILPRRFAELCATVARVVKPQGVWANSGSWHFSFRNEVENPSLAEAAELASTIGWKPLASAFHEIPYLQSAFDSHRRFETVTQFVWERNTTPVAHRPPLDDRADWIRNPKLAVPSLDFFAQGAEVHAVMALILSLVDSQRSLEDIANTLAAENGLSPEQSLDAAQSFFDRFMKDRHFREAP